MEAPHQNSKCLHPGGAWSTSGSLFLVVEEAISKKQTVLPLGCGLKNKLLPTIESNARFGKCSITAAVEKAQQADFIFSMLAKKILVQICILGWSIAFHLEMLLLWSLQHQV